MLRRRERGTRRKQEQISGTDVQRLDIEAQTRKRHIKVKIKKKSAGATSVDSRGLYDPIMVLHCRREYLLRQTVQSTRDLFENGDIDIVRWVPSAAIIADGLRKRNPVSHRLINAIALSEKLELDLRGIYELESESWKLEEDRRHRCEWESMDFAEHKDTECR